MSFFTSIILLLSLLLAGPGSQAAAGVNPGGHLAVAPSLEAGSIIISEFRTRGTGGDYDEFMELFNRGASAVNLNGLEVWSFGTGSSAAMIVQITSDIFLQPGQHFLISNSAGYSNSITPDKTFTGWELFNDGGIGIRDAGAPQTEFIDMVGMSIQSPFFEGTLLLPFNGDHIDQSYEREPGDEAGNCLDTNNNAGDFSLRSPALPQNTASALTTDCLSMESQEIIFTSPQPAGAVVGGSLYKPLATASSGLPVTITIDPTSTAVCTLTSGIVTFTAVGTCTVNADQPGNDQYYPALRVQQSITVGKGSQAVVFISSAPVGASVGGGTYVPSAAATSGLPVTLSIDASVSDICLLTSGIVSFSKAGTCVINGNQPGNSNYIPAVQVQQSFPVAEGSQTITFTTSAPASALVGGSTYAPGAVASSGLPVALSIDAAAALVCSISSGAVSFTAAGTCVIDANQPGTADYLPAVQVQQSFPVAQSATPTPTAPNRIVISEFRTSGPNGEGDEFIELFNPTGGAVNISAWSIRKSSSCGTSISTLVTIPSNIILKPGQHYLVAAEESSLSNANQVYPASLANDGGVALLNASGSIIDQAGMCAATTYKEGTFLPSLSGTANQSYERKPGGSTSCYDTNNNSVDFMLTSPSNPQNLSSLIQMCAGVDTYTITYTPTRTATRTPTATATSLPGRVLLNEFLPHPASDWNGDGLVNNDDEFIELINLDNLPISLKNWRLDDGDGGSNPYTLPSITLLARQTLILFRSDTGIALSDGGDSVRLFKPDGRLTDGTTYPVVTGKDISWCRLPDGSNWLFSCRPTPGKLNSLETSTPVPGAEPAETGSSPAPACRLTNLISPILMSECYSPGLSMWRLLSSPIFQLNIQRKDPVFVE